MENPKHQIFVNEISQHGNKTRAYKQAYPGTTDESARVGASKLMKKPEIQDALKEMYRQLSLGIPNDKQSYIYQEAKILALKREYLLGILSGDCFASINEKLRALELDNRLMEIEMVLLGYGSLKQAKNEYTYEGFAQTFEKLNTELATGTDAVQEKAGETSEVTNPETVTIRNLEKDQEDIKNPYNILNNNHLPALAAAGGQPATVTPGSNTVTYIPLGLKPATEAQPPSR